MEVFHHISVIGQAVSGCAGVLVPGPYLVAVALNILDQIVTTNAAADVSTHVPDQSCFAVASTVYRCNLYRHGGSEVFYLELHEAGGPQSHVIASADLHDAVEQATRDCAARSAQEGNVDQFVLFAVFDHLPASDM